MARINLQKNGKKTILFGGEVILNSINNSESINFIDGLSTRYPVTFKPSSGLNVEFSATSVSNLTDNKQFINNVASLQINGDNYDYITIKKVNDNYLQIIDYKNNI